MGKLLFSIFSDVSSISGTSVTPLTKKFLTTPSFSCASSFFVVSVEGHPKIYPSFVIKLISTLKNMNFFD